MGEALARQAPVDADMVVPVPESGIPAAQGFARASGIPYGDGLVKNRYVGRTFIQPSQKQRGVGVRMKLNPLPENIRGKRLVVVDDSIVRGTTTRQVVAMPCSRARANPAAWGRLLRTPTTCAGHPWARHWRTMACMLEPLPEIKTTMRFMDLHSVGGPR